MTPEREAEIREATRVPTRAYRPIDECLDAIAELRSELLEEENLSAQLRKRAEKAEAEVERLRTRCPHLCQFCDDAPRI